MKLYFHPASTTCRPIMLFAADNRIDLDCRFIDLMADEQLGSRFTAVNPNQCVPVLEVGDFRLTESAAILKYLADHIGSPAYPTGLRERARVNERMDWFNTSFSREVGYGLVYSQIFPKYRLADERAQSEKLLWSKSRALRQLDILDRDLIGANPYVCGAEMTIADYFGAAFVTLSEALHVDYSRWPNIARWLGRMKDRESWASVNSAFYTYLVQPGQGVPFVRPS